MNIVEFPLILKPVPEVFRDVPEVFKAFIFFVLFCFLYFFKTLQGF